jgi:hypothetical protein
MNNIDLRDYFAAQVMQGLVANYELVKCENKKNNDTKNISWFPETANDTQMKC